MSGIPTIPPIHDDVDLMLAVFTHSSLHDGDEPLKEPYGDTLRLRDLGRRVLELAVTYHLFSERPMLREEEIEQKRLACLSDKNIDDWMKHYGLKEKLRVAPVQQEHVASNAKEMTNLFHVYIGAVYMKHGMRTIQDWISRLIEPNTDLPGIFAHEMPQPNFGFGGPPLPLYNPPPLPSSPRSSNFASSSPLSSSYGGNGPGSTLSLVTLALVNQTAAQKNVQVTYPAESVGPSHLPTWTVKCCMNGQEFGRGTGKSQKIAKEEAARQAWAAMGWGHT